VFSELIFDLSEELFDLFELNQERKRVGLAVRFVPQTDLRVQRLNLLVMGDWDQVVVDLGKEHLDRDQVLMGVI